jgi:hypothetical protein
VHIRAAVDGLMEGIGQALLLTHGEMNQQCCVAAAAISQSSATAADAGATAITTATDMAMTECAPAWYFVKQRQLWQK